MTHKVTKNLAEQKIYETWLPRLEERSKEVGYSMSPEKAKRLAKMSHVRQIYESYATPNSVPGRGGFSFGNNPMNNDSTRGSAEVFQNLFGVFVDAAATTYGMDMMANLTMSKSNINVFITEPIYANGKINSTAYPDAFQMNFTKEGTGVNFVVGTDYQVKDGNAGDLLMTLTFVGKERVKGFYVFRVKSVETAEQGNSLVQIMSTSGAGIYASGSNYMAALPNTVDYTNAFLNTINGFAGSGKDNTAAWSLNRGNGKAFSRPMSRTTGETTWSRSLGLRQWSKNYSAETFQVDVEYTNEQIMDYKMDHDVDAQEIGEASAKNQLSQGINDYIIGSIDAYGWQHHYDMNKLNGFNMNVNIDVSSNTSSAASYLGKDFETLLSIAGVAGVIPSTGAIFENLSTLQRRIVSRILYGAAIVGTRCRQGRGNHTKMNATGTTALRDVRGYTQAEFDNDLNDADVSMIGKFNGIAVYEDQLQDVNDNRVSVWRKGTDKDTGLKFCSYLLGYKTEVIAEATGAPKMWLKSRCVVVEAGSYPELNYMTFNVDQAASYKII